MTTGFVGDRGAKGYVVSLADLNDLEVELDISQNDFAKLHRASTARDYGCFSGPQIRRLHQRDFARGQPPESHRTDQGESGEAGRVSAAGNERQRGFLPPTGDDRRPRPAGVVCPPRPSGTAPCFSSSTARPSAARSRPALPPPGTDHRDRRGPQRRRGLDRHASSRIERWRQGKAGRHRHMGEVVIETRNLNKEFVRDEFHVVALEDVSLEIAAGEFVALMGPSGLRQIHLAAFDRSHGPAHRRRDPRARPRSAGIERERRWRAGAMRTSASSFSRSICFRCSPQSKTLSCR